MYSAKIDAGIWLSACIDNRDFSFRFRIAFSTLFQLVFWVKIAPTIISSSVSAGHQFWGPKEERRRLYIFIKLWLLPVINILTLPHAFYLYQGQMLKSKCQINSKFQIPKLFTVYRGAFIIYFLKIELKKILELILGLRPIISCIHPFCWD